MFYVLVAVWFVVCAIRCYSNIREFKTAVLLAVSGIAVGAMLLGLGTPKGAGVALSIGVAPVLLHAVNTLTENTQNS